MNVENIRKTAPVGLHIRRIGADLHKSSNLHDLIHTIYSSLAAATFVALSLLSKGASLEPNLQSGSMTNY